MANRFSGEQISHLARILGVPDPQEGAQCSYEQAREAAAAMQRSQMLMIEDRSMPHFEYEGTAQLEAGPVPTREEMVRMAQNMERRINAEMSQAMQIPIFNPDQMQSPPLIGGRSAGRSRNIPMEDMHTHDITIGTQRRMSGPFIARPFARIIPDAHKATIFDNAKWEVVESALKDIDWYGRDKYFEIAGKLYVENWKRLWKKTKEEAEKKMK